MDTQSILQICQDVQLSERCVLAQSNRPYKVNLRSRLVRCVRSSLKNGVLWLCFFESSIFSGTPSGSRNARVYTRSRASSLSRRRAVSKAALIDMPNFWLLGERLSCGRLGAPRNSSKYSAKEHRLCFIKPAAWIRYRGISLLILLLFVREACVWTT